ncbi:MAG TPA: C39 family peptidase [Myxococcaceae bacterium]|nr:C39 family peptidase [Myxococcaceae bacterium]
MALATDSTPARANTPRLSDATTPTSSKRKSNPTLLVTTAPAKSKEKDPDRSEFQASTMSQSRSAKGPALLDQKSGKGGGDGVCDPQKPKDDGGFFGWIGHAVGHLLGTEEPEKPCLPPAVIAPKPQPAQPGQPAPITGVAVPVAPGGGGNAQAAQRAVTEAYQEAGLHVPNVQDPNDGGTRYQTALKALDGGAAYGDVKAGLLADLYSDPGVRALPSNQAPQKKDQIAVYDAYAHVLNRAPDAAARQQWLDPQGSGARELADLRARGGTDEDAANWISGALLASNERQDRIPSISQINPSGVEDPSTWKGGGYFCGPTSAAMIARADGYRGDIPRSEDDDFIQHLADTFPRGGTPISSKLETDVADMGPMLEEITGAPVGQHGMGGSDADSVAQMKAALRDGRLLVANGNFPGANGHYVMVSGFDQKGNFLVNDPYGWIPRECPPERLTEFLRAGNATWWDAAGPKTPAAGGTALPSPAATATPAATTPAAGTPGNVQYTGVVPGAIYNTTPSHIPPGEHTILGRQSLNAQQIDQILKDAGSPAAGQGESFVKWGKQYNIDPAYAVAFFAMESSYGTNPSWVGNQGNGKYSNSIGNIRYFGAPTADRDPQYHDGSGYRAYDSWDEGIHDWFKLLTDDPAYGGIHTIEQIVPIYAPNEDHNDEAQYIQTVNGLVDQWRKRYGT